MANELLQRLVTVYRGEDIRHPHLRAVTLAQWLLESGRASSPLARDHYNFGGLKWRKEMAPFASKVSYNAHDGPDFYCKFATIENFVAGYWAFLNRAPYTGWEAHTATAEEFIRFIGPTYTPTPGYADTVLKLIAEAEALLQAPDRVEEPSEAGKGQLKSIGTIVIDPGHGGTKNEPGSDANHAISVSGVKEKKLALDFGLILREELRRQAAGHGESVTVALTRETDVNSAGAVRAGLAFKTKAKLFLSIHFNGDPKPSTRGTETFFRAKNNNNLNLAADMEFAQAVQTALFSALKSIDGGAKDRGIKPDNQGNPDLPGFGVLNDKNLGNHKRPDPCRAAYIEVEFITNPSVDKLLISGPNAVSNRTLAMAAVAEACLAQMRKIP